MAGERGALREALFALLLAGLTLALYRSAFGVFFSTDDLLFLLRADGQVPWGMGTRRLLSVRGFFTVCWQLFGERPALFHLVILLLHAANAWLLARLARRLGLGERGAFVAALLFLFSPVAFTCLHWISGVQDVMMATFAIAALLAWLRPGRAGELLALGLYLCAILSKEAAYMLPIAALLLPAALLPGAPSARRARRLRALAALAPGFLLLVTGGALTPRAPGDPYESVFGLNLVWNALTYSAWLLRIWVPFPDQVPQYEPSLWRWGLLLPALLALLAWRRPRWRPAIGGAALMALLFLAPVLPLVRHSYLYYLYLPLAPLWLLAAAGVERLPRGLARWGLALPVLLLVLTGWRTQARSAQLLEGTLQADPMLRYGALVKDALRDLRAEKTAPAGDILVVTPLVGNAVDLAAGVRAPANARRVQFLPVDKALYHGAAVPLFFPAVTSFRVVEALPGPEAGLNAAWTRSELYLLTGLTEFTYLGRGLAGRREMARILFQWERLPESLREIDVLLALRPADPDLLYDRGILALVAKDAAGVQAIHARLAALAAAESPPGEAAEALGDFERVLARAASPGAGQREP